MLGVAVGLHAQYSARREVAFPAGFDWDQGRFGFGIAEVGGRFETDLDPRALVDPAIWTAPAFHVDTGGSDANTGLGAQDGDFSDAKRTIYAAFVAGNATGAPYRVLVKAGQYKESEFTRNGNDEPDQPVALIAWGGRVQYRTGPFDVNWNDAGGTYSASASAVKRVFRTDVLTPEGLYSELDQVPDVAACAAAPGRWALDGSTVHVNVDGAPGPADIALMRGFHGARFMQHVDDFYIEGFDLEGGITGTLHFDKLSTRNIVGVDCTFRYSAPYNLGAPLDAVRVRRVDGLCAFFRCDASFAAKDGWSFHDDGAEGMHVLLQDCSGWRNGALGATSVNAFTVHDAVRAIGLNGRFGLSRNGSELHSIQDAQWWLAGTQVVARDVDGSSVAYQCSNASQMWLERCVADAAGGTDNFAIEANGGTVSIRVFEPVSGSIEVYSGGSVTPF
ncbi:hypothetical protein [uncultured Tateyamaria sp.]|uniref:hypothetical protein n=1 Tax=uncultured Tateyamaria sp. TaxID=455651 RepID=UPI00260D49E7|nr:hypothetical protein [uncultured Tateyamaria sp.]